MSTTTFPAQWSLADLLHHLGDIPAERVRLRPAPGTAVEADVTNVHETEGRLCELIDGVLVEKTMGYQESKLAMWIGHLIQSFLDEHDLGELTGADGAMRLMPGMVRIPDVAFISNERLQNCPDTDQPIPDLCPDLAVEVLSKSNTPAEMERKLRDYFFNGCRAVWLVDPRQRTVCVATSPDTTSTLTEGQVLAGEPALPGFAVPVARLFARTQSPRPRKRGKKKP